MKLKRTYICFIILFLSFFSSCYLGSREFRDDAVLGQFRTQNRFHDIITMLQPKLDAGERVTTYQLWILTTAYYEVRDYKRLLLIADLMEKQINQGDKGPSRSLDLTGSPNLYRGRVYLDQGEFWDAIKEGKIALQLYRRGNILQLIRIYDLLGVAYALVGNKDESDKFADLLQNVSSGGFYGSEKSIAIARIYMAQKEYAKALSVITDRKSEVGKFYVSILTTFGGGMTWQDMPKLFILSKSLYETGNIAEAKEGYDKLLGHPQIDQSGGIYWIVLYDRAQISLKEGKPGQAVTFMKRAAEVIEQQRSSIDTDTGKIGFVGDKQDVYQLLVATLLAKGQDAEAFEYVERAKARALVDILAKRQKFAYRGQTPEKTAALLTELAVLEAKSQSYSADNVEDGKIAATRGIVIKAHEDLAKTAPELSSLVTVTSPKTAEIQKLLKPDETLLEYYTQGDNLFAFVLAHEGIKAVKLNGRGLTDIIRNLRQAVQNPESNNYKSLSEELYNRIIAPVPGATAKANMIIVPHGALHYLPFNMLSNGKDYLIDRVSIRILPSASVMPFLANRQQAPLKKVLILGNPDLGDPKMNLGGAEAEAKTIQKIWPDSVLLLRKQATKSVVMKAGAQFRMIHIAAHGIFNAEQPLESALLLSPDPGNNGKLTVGELYETTLNADIITLSACETGLGKISNGDDVVGLTRGFLYAGAGSIVASLWPVPDTETMFLMNNFYTNLKVNMGPETIRKAQLTAKEKYPHPYYWAAFQWIGSGS
jgi:CHAT domain-containing protein